MNTYLSSAQLKDMAKDKLAGRYGLLIGAGILVNIITLFASCFLWLFLPAETTIAGFIISNLMSFLFSVVMGVFEIGVALIYLKSACGGIPTLGDIFYGFHHQFEKSLQISLVLNAIAVIPTLAYSVPYFIYRQTNLVMFQYLIYPCLILALVAYILLSLKYSQCLYLLLDFPDKSASEILSLSNQIMVGHKKRLFYIEISFIPLFLLGCISVVGLLWVMPYMQMTFVAFFFDIMKPGQRT